VFIGLPISAVRAGIFWMVVVMSAYLGLLTSLPTAMLTVLTVVLTIEPAMVRDVGLQLSVAAVSGIFMALFLVKKRREDSSYIVSSLVISGGALAATWPVVAWYFGIFPPMSLLTNLLVVPIVSVIMLSGAAALWLSLIWWPAGRLLTIIVHGFDWWILSVTEFMAKGPVWQELFLKAWHLVVYYVLLALASYYWLKWQKRSWREIWG
jgi:competence protein ComEC